MKSNFCYNSYGSKKFFRVDFLQRIGFAKVWGEINMNYTYYLKSAMKKMKAHDKNEVANRLTPMERQAIIVISAIISFPLLITGLMWLFN